MPGSYADSTQSNHWLLSEEDIAELRARRGRSAPPPAVSASPGGATTDMAMSPYPAAAGLVAAEHSSPGGSAETPGGASGMLVSPMPGGDADTGAGAVGGAGGSGEGGGLSVEEEGALRVHYEMRLQEICDDMYKAKRMQRPSTEENIASTAITYFKRFYLHQSLAGPHHPVPIMLASLYTATKIEEVWFGAMLDEILKAADKEKRLLEEQGSSMISSGNDGGGAAAGGDAKSIVVEHEMTLISVLQFHLIVFHPYRPLRSFLSQYQEWNGSTIDRSAEDLATLHRRSTRKISLGFAGSDLPLLYTPAQIALAALSLVSEEILEPDRNKSPTWASMQSDVQQFVQTELLSTTTGGGDAAAAADADADAAAAVEDCRRKVDDIRTNLKAAESEHRKYHPGQVYQPPERISGLEARLSLQGGGGAALPTDGAGLGASAKRSASGIGDGDARGHDQLQRPFKSPKV